MVLKPNDFSRIYTHSAAMNQRLWVAIETLTDEQFVQETAYSHGSVRDQVTHLAGSTTRWRLALQGDPDYRAYSLDAQDYPTLASARGVLATADREMADYVAQLTVEDLAANAPGTPGPRWEALIHIFNHSTDHRAQVLRQLADFGVETFPQDLIFTLWPRPGS